MAPPEQQNSAGQGPDPREAIQELVRAILQNKVRVIFTSLVFLMIGVGLAMIWPVKYASGTNFVVKETRIVADSSLLGDVLEFPIERKLTALNNDLKSVKRIYAVMDELQWPEWLQTNSSPSRRRALYMKVKSNLSVSMHQAVTGGLSVSIKFQWTSPSKAADLANRLRDAWIKLVMESYRRGVEAQMERAEAVVRERENEYKAALAARHKYEQENNVPKLLDVQTNNGLKVDLIVKIAEAKAALEAAVTKIESLRVDLQGIDKELTVPVELDNPEQQEAYAAVLAARDHFEDISEDYREAHPKHVDAHRDLRQAEADLQELGGEPEDLYEQKTNPVYYDRAQELETALNEELQHRAMVSSLEARLNEVEQNLEQLPRVTMDMASLTGDVESTGLMLTQAKEAAQPLRERVRQLRNANTTVGQDQGVVSGNAFEILETAIEPENPVLPMGAVLIAVFLMIGVGVGLVGPVLGRLTSGSFGTVKEVTRGLGVPVLGAVDMILTSRDVRARSVQSALTITTMVLVLLALGTALYIYAAHKEVLPAKLLRAIRDIELSLT